MYFIRHGTVMIHGDEGGAAILNMLNRGDFFGEIAVLTTVPRIAYATAVTMCDFFELSKSDVDEVWSYTPYVRVHLWTGLRRVTVLSGRRYID